MSQSEKIIVPNEVLEKKLAIILKALKRPPVKKVEGQKRFDAGKHY